MGQMNQTRASTDHRLGVDLGMHSEITWYSKFVRRPNAGSNEVDVSQMESFVDGRSPPERQ